MPDKKPDHVPAPPDDDVSNMNDAARAEVAGSRWTGRLLVVLALVVLAGVALHYGLPGRAQAFLKGALDWMDGLGMWAPIAFVALYVVACVALVPASILTLGAGAVFGLWKGAVLVFIGATLGATAAFLVSRHAARGWVTRKFGGHPLFAALERAVAAEGWKIVFLTRLAPVFPFFLLNYIYGLTRVSLKQYVVATAVGIIPGSTLFVYLGWVARRGAQGATTMDWVKWGFILVTAIIAMVYLGKIARRELSKRLDAKPETGGD